MLNLIWSALIISSILFALGYDLLDEKNNPYNNGQSYDFQYSPAGQTKHIKLISGQQIITAQWASRQSFQQLVISTNQQLPPLWQKIARLQQSENKDQLYAKVIQHHRQQLSLLLPEVHWVKTRAVTQAAFDMAEFAVKLALGLAGIMALWLGLMKIAEQSGLMKIFVKLIRPLLNYLFPEIPKDHPALSSISLNLAANVLGLGNAATPMGIKAMQQLQTLNNRKDQASDAMCMFLALNTSSVQLLPPLTLIALMGTQVSELIVPIILATSTSTLVAIFTAKYFARRNRSCNTAA